MEEEIEILEELIQFLKSDDVEETFDDFTPEILALENLLKAYKELKEENKTLKNRQGIGQYTELTGENLDKVLSKWYINKSKVKEKIEGLEKRKDACNDIEIEIRLDVKIRAYKELLGEE